MIGLLGASVLGPGTFVEDLIHAFRFDGWSVSIIKRGPDGFDLDQSGEGSYARCEAGCHEVILVGDKRLVLMQEFGAESEPSLESLLARLVPVGFGQDKRSGHVRAGASHSRPTSPRAYTRLANCGRHWEWMPASQAMDFSFAP